MAITSSCAFDSTPRVWISSLGAYNEGFLIGRWVDAIDVAAVTANDLFEGSPYCWADEEELWCFDIENMLTRSEMSPQEASRQAEAIESVDEHLRPALMAWVESGDYVAEDNSDLPSVPDFEERFCGHWDSFEDCAEEYVEDSGMLSEIPEDVARYFDHSAFARDLAFDYATHDNPDGGVFVFRVL